MSQIYKLPDNSLGEDERLYVREMQTYLRRIALENGELPVLAIDGFYGPETRAAVEIFQRLYGLPATGVVDRETWDSIYREFKRIAGAEGYQTAALAIEGFGEPQTLLKPGSSGDAVVFLQTMINALAESYLNIKPVPTSGVYDAETSSAIAEMQRIAGLPVNGFTDKNTWNAIVREYNRLERQPS